MIFTGVATIAGLIRGAAANPGIIAADWRAPRALRARPNPPGQAGHDLDLQAILGVHQ